MALKNNYLIAARKNKNDEFYTRYEDISETVLVFKENFKDKIVYCPCDNKNSNFPKFFKEHFTWLKLRGLYYSAIDGEALFYDGHNEKKIGEHIDITSREFEDVCCQCDIVVTNPPFSLFVPFCNKIIQLGKDCLIVGSQNAISCKTIFQHIKDGQLFPYYGFKSCVGFFYKPENYKDVAKAKTHMDGMIRVSGVIWFSSFENRQNKSPITLTKSYYEKPEEYPFYDNFREISGLDEDAINVNKTKDIPFDWEGIMGVPISFFAKYCPKQFEIIQLDHYGKLGNLDNMVNGKTTYRRIYIKKRKENG